MSTESPKKSKRSDAEPVRAASSIHVPSPLRRNTNAVVLKLLRDDAMMRYMELLAVFECSSRRMLPERYKGMSSSELNAEVREQQRRLLRA